MKENSLFDKKSLQLITAKSPAWKELAMDCVAFANAQGGEIHIGIEDNAELPDKNQRINNDLIHKINKIIPQQTINVGIKAEKCSAENGGEFIKLRIFRSAQTVASTSNGKYYIRISDESKPVLPDELTRLVADKNSFVWETQTTKKIHRKQYDPAKLNGFLDLIIKSDRVSNFIKEKSPDEILEHFFLTNGNFLTNLGILWIGNKKDRATLSYAPVIQFTKFDEHEKKISKRVWDDYSLNPAELVSAVLTEIPEFSEGQEITHGMFRSMIPNYDRVVIRELIVNALVHRPYTMSGDIFINLFPDRLEIHNPGLLPLGVTPENILHTTVKRNELLASVFYVLRLMEREGSGYDMMYAKLLSQAKKIPVVEERYDRVTVTLEKRIIKPEMIEFVEKADKAFQLSQKEMISLGLIAQHGSLSALEFSKTLALEGQERIRNWLGRLLEYGLIKSRGKTRGVQYFVPSEILQKMDFKGKTTLKRIESHRLEELIRHDIELYPNSKFGQIHQRIGKEIPVSRLKRSISNLVKSGVLNRSGTTNAARYKLVQKYGK